MAEKDSRRFAILADDTYVGNIYLTDINDKTAEYHIFIGGKTFGAKASPEQRQKG
jgi:diamine N-acetyltransferase